MGRSDVRCLMLLVPVVACGRDPVMPIKPLICATGRQSGFGYAISIPAGYRAEGGPKWARGEADPDIALRFGTPTQPVEPQPDCTDEYPIIEFAAEHHPGGFTSFCIEKEHYGHREGGRARRFI